MSYSRSFGTELTRERQLLIRTAMLDMLWCLQNNEPPNPRMQHRIKAGWDAAKLPEDTPLQFFPKDERRIILPIGPTAAMPRI